MCSFNELRTTLLYISLFSKACSTPSRRPVVRSASQAEIRRRPLTMKPSGSAKESATTPGYRTAMVGFRPPWLHEKAFATQAADQTAVHMFPIAFGKARWKFVLRSGRPEPARPDIEEPSHTVSTRNSREYRALSRSANGRFVCTQLPVDTQWKRNSDFSIQLTSKGMVFFIVATRI